MLIKKVWFQNRRAKWRRQEKAEQTSLRVNPDFPMANLRNTSTCGNQSISSSSTSPSSSGGSINQQQPQPPQSHNHTSSSTLPLVDPWLQATQFHQFSNFINQQAAYSQFFPSFQNVAASPGSSSSFNNNSLLTTSLNLGSSSNKNTN